jgi:hypothetical protein
VGPDKRNTRANWEITQPGIEYCLQRINFIILRQVFALLLERVARRPGGDYGNGLNDPEIRRSNRLPLPLDDGKAYSLRDPGRGISVGREALGFLDKMTKARDADFVSVPVVEDLVRGITHERYPCHPPPRQGRALR